jgi:uncharacterized protein (TIGR03435 family)
MQPVYFLTVAKSGFKLKDGDTLPESEGYGFGNGTTTRLVRRNLPLSNLVFSLSGLMGHHILDHTGLTGTYSFVLQWPKDQPAAAAPGAPDVPAVPLTDPSAAIAEALRGQLGLNLESGKAPVDVVVIERVEKPSAN